MTDNTVTPLVHPGEFTDMLSPQSPYTSSRSERANAQPCILRQAAGLATCDCPRTDNRDEVHPSGASGSMWLLTHDAANNRHCLG